MDKLHNLKIYNQAVHMQREVIRRGVYCVKYGIDMPILHTLAAEEKIKENKRKEALKAGVIEVKDE